MTDTTIPRRSRGAYALLLLVIVAVLGLAACGEPGRNDDGVTGERRERPDAPPEASGGKVRLVTHDSFNVTDEVLQRFRDETGIEVEILRAGDANQVVNQAILTKDNPQGDVLFGIDNSLLTRAFEEDLFIPYDAPGLDQVDDRFERDPEHRVTPIDFGDVCVNYDREYFEGQQLPLPSSLEDLVDPRYRDLLVVENPTTSSPGLAFLLATIEAFGEDGWEDYWRALKDNGVTVAGDWEQAYYGMFSGGSGEGTHPLVVSYASSPPVEVEDPQTTPPDQAPTGVIPATCYRQIEFAGILRGTGQEENARKLIDFLLSTPFQEDVPLAMYVYPVRQGATLPEAFTKYSVVVDDPFELPPEKVAVGREEWLEAWTGLFR